MLQQHKLECFSQASFFQNRLEPTQVAHFMVPRARIYSQIRKKNVPEDKHSSLFFLTVNGSIEKKSFATLKHGQKKVFHRHCCCNKIS
jgi:hypothetical protein